MRQIRIENISGGTYPLNVYIADIYGNNKNLIGAVSAGPVPPTVTFNTTIPQIFQGADEVMLILTGNNGCEIFKILDCTYCTYQIIISLI